jgi:tetratricopeptide (TPR) repeat protein
VRASLIAVCIAGSLLAACLSPEERQTRAVAESKAALAAGDPARAERVLRAALAYDPRAARVSIHLARVLEDAAAPWEAFRLLERLPTEERSRPGFLLLHARLQARIGRGREAARALAALERAGKTDERSIEVLLAELARRRFSPDGLVELPIEWRVRLAGRLIEEGQIEWVGSWLERIPDSHPRRAGLIDLLLRRALEPGRESTLGTVERWVEPADTIHKLLIRRRLLAARGDFRLAAVDERILRLYPDHPARAESLLAAAHRALAAGDAETALARADEAIALETRNADAIVGRGLALRALGRHDEALSAFELALATDPSSAVARRALEKPQEALEAIRIEVGVP